MSNASSSQSPHRIAPMKSWFKPFLAPTYSRSLINVLPCLQTTLLTFYNVNLSTDNLSCLNWRLSHWDVAEFCCLMHKLAYVDLHPLLSFILLFVLICMLRRVGLLSNCQSKTCMSWHFQFSDAVCTLRTCKIKTKDYYVCCKPPCKCFSFLKIILDSASSSLTLTLLFLPLFLSLASFLIL